MEEEKFEYFVQATIRKSFAIYWGRGECLMDAYNKAKAAAGGKPDVAVGWKFPDGYEIEFDIGYVRFKHPDGEKVDMSKVTKIDIINDKKKK